MLLVDTVVDHREAEQLKILMEATKRIYFWFELPMWFLIPFVTPHQPLNQQDNHQHFSAFPLPDFWRSRPSLGSQLNSLRHWLILSLWLTVSSFFHFISLFLPDLPISFMTTYEWISSPAQPQWLLLCLTSLCVFLNPFLTSSSPSYLG